MQQLDLNLAVKELHVLNSRELGKLIRDAENGTIRFTKQDGSPSKMKVESLARHLCRHIMTHLLSYKQDEQHFRYLLSGFRLLHTLYDVTSYNLELHKVSESIFSIDLFSLCRILDSFEFSGSIWVVIFSQTGQKIDDSSEMVLLYSAMLPSSLYLLRPLISWEWHKVTLVLLAHSEANGFTIAAFTAVHVVTNFLQDKLQAQDIDYRIKSNVNEVYCLLLHCEASLQFLQSLCKQMLFREYVVKNKKLCEEGVVLELVQNIMQLPQCEDPHLMDVVYRLKSKVLSIMILLCEVESVPFLDMAFSSSQSLQLAESTVLEVLEVLKVMFYGDLKDEHRRGILQLNAMRLTEIFSAHSSFRTCIISHLTEALTRVFSQPRMEFLSTWCSNDREPAEEDIVMEFDPISAAGQVLGVITTSQVRHSTWSNFQAPQTPYTHQRSSLLVKILNNLTCYALDLPEGEKAFFINEFLECLQNEFLTLPGGAAERTAAANRNLSSLFRHAKSLTPECLNVEDVLALGGFISQLEELLKAQESDIHRLQEFHNRDQCPSPTPQISSPNEHDRNGNDDGCVPVSLAMVRLDQLTFKENCQNESNDMVGEDEQMIDLGDNSGAQNTETVDRMQDVEELRSVQSDEKQQKKRKRSKMSDDQIAILESALLDLTDLKKGGSLEFWADKLSFHGPQVTSSQLRNWLSNRKAKLARTAAKKAQTHSDSDDDLTEKQAVSDSPESLNDEHYDPSPSVSHLTRQKDPMGSVSRIRGTETTPDPVMVPTDRFKHEVGQYVMLLDDQGQDVGKGIIHLARGVWFGQNLVEQKLCVVDVHDIKVPKGTRLPHPSDAGSRFSEAELILGRMRILWDSSQLLLIQHQ
ncbi:hypothetical protein SSX86_022107 [Deinandra increscens subsp. villosa]|uniref:Homeobox domain-containing protein n=1 Tax=Deinandra increscens subsp. villosa TaxID=3103831 RepID=A0AAP0CN83_9ASTR